MSVEPMSVDSVSVESGQPGAAIVVFDGVCVLCNGWVRFLLRHDRRGRYRFAAMQGKRGGELLTMHGLDPRDPVSFLLVEGERAWTGTDAIVRVVARLGAAWRLAWIVLVVPRAIRDPLYGVLARNRYRWFGRHDRCVVPTPEQASRFLS